MLFIPQEIKEKLSRLEEENKRLEAEVNRLEHELQEPQPLNQKVNLNWWTIGALAIALLYIAFMHFYIFPKSSVEQDPAVSEEAVIIRDGQIEKWDPSKDSEIVYRVQLGAYESFDLEPYKQNLEGLHQDSIDGFKKVSLGAFSRLADAQRFLDQVNRMGLENTYIVAYKSNLPIGLIEAQKQQP